MGDMPYEDDRYGQCAEYNGNIAIYLKNMNGSLDQAVLAHEVFHAVDFVFDNKGLGFFSDGNNEHFAYYIQFLVEKVNEAFHLEKKFLERFNDNN